MRRSTPPEAALVGARNLHGVEPRERKHQPAANNDPCTIGQEGVELTVTVHEGLNEFNQPIVQVNGNDGGEDRGKTPPPRNAYAAACSYLSPS